jgi:DNA-binding CsgD family transcriptional regulator
MHAAPQPLSPAELACVLAAERRGATFLGYRDGTGDLRLQDLDRPRRLSVGRGPHNDLALEWDNEVSRTHAHLERMGPDWTLVDDGLSRNGSFVNGERVVGRRRLRDGDVLRVGRTSLQFRTPAAASPSTMTAAGIARPRLTPAEHRVLVALCRPFASSEGAAVPASNKDVADELHLSTAGVKTHVRALFAKFEIDDLPQYRKRAELAHRALASGLVGAGDLAAAASEDAAPAVNGARAARR